MLPMVVTTSAIRLPSIILGRALKFRKKEALSAPGKDGSSRR